MHLMSPNKSYHASEVSKKQKPQSVGLLIFFSIIICITLTPLLLGERVEPLSIFRFTDVSFYSFNVFTESLVAVTKDGTVLVISPEGPRTIKLDPQDLKAVHVLEDGYLLLHRGDSLELLTLHGDSKTLYVCRNIKVRNVYSKFVLIECGGSLLLDIFRGEVISIPFNVRPLNTWKHVVILDLDRFALVILTERGWTRVNYSLTADVAFSMEGISGIYIVLADGSVLLLNPITFTLKMLGAVKPLPPVAVVQVNGVEQLVLRDGTMIDEHGRLNSLRFHLTFMVERDGLFALTDEGHLLYREKTGVNWIGPLFEFVDRVLAVIPAKHFIDAPAVMVASLRGNVLEVLTIGYRDFKLTVTLPQQQVYALERAEVTVEVDREGEMRGAVLLREGDRTVDRVGFDSPGRRTSVSILPSEPGCYDVYVEVAPHSCYPFKSVHAGRLCVNARPISCQLQAVQSEVEEGGEVLLKLRVLDARTRVDVTNDVLARLPSLNVSHVLPDGSEEVMLQPPTDTLRVRLRGVGTHELSVLIAPSGPYSQCSTNPTTVSVRTAVNTLLIAMAIGGATLSAAGVAFYMRTRTSIWRGIERAVSEGTSCEELVKKLSDILSEKVAQKACEFVSIYRRVYYSLNELLVALRPLEGVDDVRRAILLLESARGEISACKSIYLKGDPENALMRLNELIGRLHDELIRLTSVLAGEKYKLEEERRKFEEYLGKLEQYKDKASSRAYLKLKSEYETKLKRAEEDLSNIEDALRILEVAIRSMYSTFKSDDGRAKASL